MFLQGRDKITLQTKGDEEISWENIIDYIHKFIEAYSQDTYKTLFPSYANFEQIIDGDILDELDSILLKYIKSKMTVKIHLCVPEFIADDEYGFVYCKHRGDYQMVSFMEIEDFYKPDRHVFAYDTKDLEIDILKNTPIYAYSYADGKVLEYKSWKVYDCIIAEIPLNDDTYILSAGVWRKVNSDFMTKIYNGLPQEKDVDDKFKNIQIWDQKDLKNKESIYNEAIANLPGIIMFDRSKSAIGDRDKIYEFCDLMEISGNKIELIHVKQNGGSSQVSYLFTQAKTYGESFLYDKTFLDDIREHISNYEKITDIKKAGVLSKIPEDVNNNKGDMYNVGLWILYDKTKSKPVLKDLPLMALYELKQAHEILKTRNKYNEVYVSFIPVEKIIQKKTTIPKKTKYS
jgi:uncharacterized protein (TIGR04141 family)